MISKIKDTFCELIASTVIIKIKPFLLNNIKNEQYGMGVLFHIEVDTLILMIKAEFAHQCG